MALLRVPGGDVMENPGTNLSSSHSYSHCRTSNGDDNNREGYDPNKSKVSEDKMTAFSEADLTGDLQQIPGIGPAAIAKLNRDSVMNSFHLLGTYIKLCELEQDEDGETRVDTFSLNQCFWIYLKNLDIVAHRSAIVKATSSKAGMLLPGFLDATTYGDMADNE